MSRLHLSFTTEALVCLAVNYGLRPQPLLLMQLGFDTDAANARAEFLRILDRGARTLLSVHDSAEPSDETKQQVRHNVEQMSGADVFASLRRSDRLGSRVIYCGDTSIVDEIGEDGNHQLRVAEDLPIEVGSFFEAYSSEDNDPVVAPLQRFELGAESNEGEPAVVGELASDESIVYLVSIGYPADGRLTMLRWRGIGHKLFEFEVDDEQAKFNPTNTDAVAAKISSVVSSIEQDDPAVSSLS